MSQKVALVTGGNTGIGKTIVLTLASEGFDILLNYVVMEEEAIKVKEEVEGMGRTCTLLFADVSNYEAVESMMEKAFTAGRIDVLVNNAGITRDQLLVAMTEQEFDAVINVNLKGTFNCMKHAARKMLKQRAGKIINMASVIGLMGNAGQINYAASKAAVIGMTKSIAKEFAPRNIQVNAIAPGFIETAMTDKIPAEAREKMIAEIPLKRLGQPQDIANAVAFLASDKADYITGQVLVVDGGMVM
jgi:3-oxoacyl-[acyl-carrier protein] reductase